MRRSTSTEPPRSTSRRASWWRGRTLFSLARRDRRILATIFVFLTLIGAMVGYNVVTTQSQRDTALVVNITARQRTLVERYIKDLLLKLEGVRADPGPSRDVLVSTATALLEGGPVAAPQGSPDATVTISPIREKRVRRQLEHARELINQLTTTGDRVLAAGSTSKTKDDDVYQMRILAAQLSSVTGDAAGGVTRNARDALSNLVRVELVLGLLSAIAAVAMGLLLRRAGARQSARFKSLVHNAVDLITVIDPRGRVTYQSPSSERVLGFPPSEIVGTPFASLVRPDERALVAELLSGEGVGLGETVSVRFALWSKKGLWRPMEGSITDLTADRSVGGLVVNVHDVTDRDEAAAALAVARDQAMEASRLKSQFLASMSHEIRTPMNAVIGLSELLLETGLTLEQREYAQGVYRAGEGLLAIIDEILDFSKVEAGRVQLERVGFDLSELVDEVATLLGDVANAKGVELLAHCASDLPTGVRGDPTRLRQILVNLTSNAVKFTEVGEVLIRAEAAGVVTRQDDVDTLPIRFEVRDTGIGISDQAKEYIFDPFSQADVSTTRKFGGTGLGLAIVGQLVELMGGQVGVESKPGVGSTFWFVIPVELLPRAEVAPAAATLTGLHALVVDDNATNRLILTEQLRSWGIRAEEAEDGPTAVVRARYMAVRGDAYDAAILDLNMPEMDGLEVAKALRDDPTTAEARLFMLSSSGRVSATAAEAVGLSGSLTKPVRKSDLYNCLVEGFSKSEATEGAAKPAIPSPATPSAASAVTPTSARGTVLLVEDNATNRLVASRIIERLGFVVAVAENGREAVEMLATSRQSAATRYAVIFMDCQMPVMDGYEATRAMRTIEGSEQRTPIIAMTAAAMEGDREACLAAGMDDYLAKPIRPELVGAVLAKWAPGAGVDAVVDEPATIGGDVIDLSRLELLRRLDRGGGDLLDDVLGQYLGDTTERLSALHTALEGSDVVTVAQVAHAMRGASANVGAAIMSALCARIEDLAGSGDAASCGALLPVLESEYERVRRALTTELGRAAGATPR